MTIGDFLYKLFDWIGAIIPFRIVQQWERGVRMLWGRTRTELRPGLHWFWPLAGDILTVAATPRIVELDHQTVQVDVDRSLTFSLTVRYRVTSAKRLYESIWDADSTIQDAARGIAGHHASWLEGSESGTDFAAKVLVDVSEEVADWGIEVEDIGVCNFAFVPALRLMTDTASKGAAPAFDLGV